MISAGAVRLARRQIGAAGRVRRHSEVVQGEARAQAAVRPDLVPEPDNLALIGEAIGKGDSEELPQVGGRAQIKVGWAAVAVHIQRERARGRAVLGDNIVHERLRRAHASRPAHTL